MRRLLLHWLLPASALFGAIYVLIQASILVAGGRTFDLGAYSSIQFVLNTNAAALASTLGILMAIVLLMVQLTAQRYSFNIVGMFVNNPRNVSLVALFIVTISFNLWLAAAIDQDYVPQFGTYLALGMGTLCFGLLLPYFAYLFESLKPHNLLNALQRETLAAVDSAGRGRSQESARRLADEKLRQTGDITRTAVSLSDADVARYSVLILFGTLCDYLERKPNLPRDWFAIEEGFFPGRHTPVIQEIEGSGTWFERRILEEFQSAFISSLNRLEPVHTAVSLSCRRAGERALELGDEAAVRLLIKFFNTFLRAALNARDARAGYNLLFQYALLAEAAYESRPDLGLEIAHRIAYYGEAAIGMDVVWMAAAAAQDLRGLVEAAVRCGMPRETTSHIQGELLELVREAEIKRSPTTSLLQKAILALGAFQLEQGQRELARDLASGLGHIDPKQLSRLVADLAEVTDPQFWELTDRGVNFEYVEEGPRARLADFVALATAEDGRTETTEKRLEVAN
jgi:hypothetical protein